jgi:hypothetical protein
MPTTVLTTDQALTARLTAQEARLLGFTDFSEYGTPNDENFDNNTVLETLVASGKTSIYFPGEDWHFDGPIDLTNILFDNVRFYGAGSEFAAQHQEEGGQGNKQLTRFILHMDNDSDIWWEHIRAYRYGILEFCDITFQVPTKGSVFAFGDISIVDTFESTFRGLQIERCYGTFLNYSYPHLIDNDEDGFTINRTNTNFFLRIHQGYDVVLRDVACRGFYTNIILSHCDRPVLDNVRGLVCYKHIECYGILNAQAPVAGHADNLYVEDSFLGGFHLESLQVTKLRLEVGYDTIPEVPDPYAAGVFTLPSTVTWSITAGSAVMTFNNFGTGFDATDYFEPKTVIRVTSEDEDEPYRDLYINTVSTSSLVFRNATSTSYVHRTISGIGTGINRYFPQSVIMSGNRAEMLQPSLNLNEATSTLPLLWIVPGTVPVKVGSNCESKGDGNINPIPVIVASCAGIANGTQGGVDYIGSSDCPNHPMVNKGGLGPAYAGDYREGFYDEATDKQIFMPARGVRTANDASKLLMFYPIEDEGRIVWCYRPADCAAAGWQVILRKSGRTATYSIRCYAPTSGLSLNIWGGGGSANTPALTTGWNTITGTLTGILDPGGTQLTSNVFQLGGAGYFASKIIISQ